MQYHYVGLDKVSYTCRNGERTVTNSTDTVHDPLDDTVVKGDEDISQITGGPQASMMSLENPEAFGQIFSIAPAEGQKSLSIMTDSHFEAINKLFWHWNIT